MKSRKRYGLRPRKHYGPVHKRGVTNRVQEQAEEARLRREVRQASRILPAGTVCHVRKCGEKVWRPYRTKKEIICKGYLWRNRTHHGLTWGVYEIKVCNVFLRSVQV